MDKKQIRNNIIDAIAIMDEKGRANEGDNSYMLWKKEWTALRECLLNCLRTIDGR